MFFFSLVFLKQSSFFWNVVIVNVIDLRLENYFREKSEGLTLNIRDDEDEKKKKGNVLCSSKTTGEIVDQTMTNFFYA